MSNSNGCRLSVGTATSMDKEAAERQQQLRRKFRKLWYWSCLPLTHLLLLFLLCTLASTLHFLPLLLLPASSPPSPGVSVRFASGDNATFPPPTLPLPPPQQTTAKAEPGAFTAVGSAAYLFVHMATYRTGPASFAVLGLSSKPLHVFARPVFTCLWHPPAGGKPPAAAPAVRTLPDWGFGRVYTTLVLGCAFNSTAAATGRLVLRAAASAADPAVELELLRDPPALPAGPPRHSMVYCGSPLYGNLSPQRVREWVAYHAHIFGEDAHFALYDAGGVSAAVARVLRPWMNRGLVALHDVRGQERFDGYYHNQFLVLNDCLHRHRFDARWIFFFDIDEFVYVSPGATLASLLEEMAGVTQFTFEQRPMSPSLCLARDNGRTPRMWGFEKLVYRDVKRGVRRDRKYAIQPRNVFATGVHMSQNFEGKSIHRSDGRIKYFHYHGTINDRRDPCRQFVDGPNLTSHGTPYVLDTTLRPLAKSIKNFELKMIGKRLQRTRE